MNAALNTLAQFGVFSNKVAKSSSTVVDPKLSFAKYANQSIAALRSGAPHKWLTRNADGSVGVQLKRGVTALLINNQNQITCASAEQAIGFLTQAQVLVAAGHLDAELEAAKPVIDPNKPRKSRASKTTTAKVKTAA